MHSYVRSSSDVSLTRRIPCPDGPPKGRKSLSSIALIAAGLLATFMTSPATAALSRWSASNNRIYVYGGGNMSLTDVSATTPSLPATALQHDAASGTWLLTANIVVQDGTQLDLTSNDIKVLRLQSNPSSAPATDVTNFVSITADYGNVNIKGITITSWDTAANGPDTNPADGRAFIRVRSSQDATSGAALESRMDVVNSDVGYLGYDAAESYGLSWKVVGTSPDHSLYDTVDVLGNVTGSHIHHNEFGIYTFGLQDGQWTDNEVDHNIGYGFDAHDDSDNLVIDNNNVHDNGVGSPDKNHGIILSERCDNAQITNNTSSGNGGNGIMLHDLSNGATVEGNTVMNNGDSGIALFCSTGATVKDNTSGANGNGIRLSVAASGNTIDGNTFDGNTAYGIYMYQGTDSNGICGSNLVPNGNTFTNNTVGSSGTNGVKITEGDGNTFQSNTFNDGISIKNSAFTAGQTVSFIGNTFGSGVVLSLDGSATTPLVANVSKSPRVSVHVDTGATAHFNDDQGAIFDLPRDILVDVTGSNSSLDATSSNAGTDFVVDTRPLLVNAGSGTVHVAPTLWTTDGDRAKAFIVRSDDAANSITYSVGDLQKGVRYDVKRGDAEVGSFVADGSGKISFSDATGSNTSTVTYNVTKSAVQPQAGNGGGGGGALDPALLALLAALGLSRRRKATLG